jgi:hypothetical protein
MRMTVTMPVACVLSVGVGVSSANAQAILDACRDKKGVYRLVDIGTECRAKEDPAELTLRQASRATRIGPLVFEAAHLETTSPHLSCDLRDELNDVDIPTSRLSHTFRITCYKFTGAMGSALRTINADQQGLTANCVDPLGEIVLPEIMVIRCTLE